MAVIVTILFLLGYLAIIFEGSVKIDKTAAALLTATLCWSVMALAPPEEGIYNLPAYVEFASRRGTETHTEGGVYMAFIGHSLAHHMEQSSQILFFILGAMVIVELVDAHNGFAIISNRIKAKNQGGLLIIVCLITFFLSAILDNLTTAIVMMSMGRKLIGDAKERMLFAGMVIIAANAGGAWSPMGDVTTTMLWIGGQISPWATISTILLPALVCIAVPMAIVYYQLRGKKVVAASASAGGASRYSSIDPQHQQVMFYCGIGALLFVPVFKTITHLPPYLGMLLGLGFVWFVSEILHRGRDEEDRRPLSASAALQRIDTASVLFFLGILLAIGALETMDILSYVASALDGVFGNKAAIAYVIGLLSAVVDNVPLVAATMGMYPLETFPKDDALWQMLAYSTGTGGSILIIGSAAGVAIMGMEKIDFLWYLKRIGGLALLGYTAGMVLLALLV